MKSDASTDALVTLHRPPPLTRILAPGIFAPSTRVEDEKIGPLADEVKSTATEAGQEALDHGKQVAKAAAESAVETAKHEGKEHGEELASSVQEKAREATTESA